MKDATKIGITRHLTAATDLIERLESWASKLCPKLTDEPVKARRNALARGTARAVEHMFYGIRRLRIGPAGSFDRREKHSIFAGPGMPGLVPSPLAVEGARGLSASNICMLVDKGVYNSG